jgi:hypothetical protein
MFLLENTQNQGKELDSLGQEGTHSKYIRGKYLLEMAINSH